jgi:hypothetical protein
MVMCKQIQVIFSYITPQPEMSNPLRMTTRQLHLPRNNKHCALPNATYRRRKKELNPLRPEIVTGINATTIGCQADNNLHIQLLGTNVTLGN